MAKKNSFSEKDFCKQIQEYPIVGVDKLMLKNKHKTGLRSEHNKEEAFEVVYIKEENLFEDEYDNIKIENVKVEEFGTSINVDSGIKTEVIKDEFLDLSEQSDVGQSEVIKDNFLDLSEQSDVGQLPRDRNDASCSKNSSPWPLSLCSSKGKETGKGVWTNADLPKGLLFGPYEGTVLNLEEQGNESGCDWRIEDEISPVNCIDASNTSIRNWLRFVKCSKCCDESNLEAFDYNGLIYYKTVTNIRRGTELMVWYRDELQHKFDENNLVLKEVEELVPRLVESFPAKVESNQIEATEKKAPTEDNIHYTGGKRHQCSHCNKNFIWKSALARHIRTHTGEKPFQCLHCDKRCGDKANLKNHIKTHTGEQKDLNHQCPHCDKKLTRKSDLISHIRTHTGEKPFQCSHCDKKFNKKSDLIRHIKIHSAVKSLECSQCDKTFSRKSYLIAHYLTHTGEKPFQCSYCDQKCKRKQELLLHTRTHTGEKPFQCSHCDKRFNRKSYLNIHIRTHTGEKPFQCFHCEKRFNVKTNLKSHIRTHTEETGSGKTI